MSRSRESSLGSDAMEEEEDDLYGAEPGTETTANGTASAAQEVESGEEEEDEDESDIEIVTERADLGPEATTAVRTGAQKPADSSQAAASAATTIQPTAKATPTTVRISADASAQQAITKPILLPGDKYPAIRSTTSQQFDLDRVPLWDGKPVTELDLDADIAEQMKPWRRPGADQSDYFNYGFDEFTWAMYCERQKSMRANIEEQKNESKMFEQMMGGMGMPMPNFGAGAAVVPQGGNSPMPGAAGMSVAMPGQDEMQGMMMQYMQMKGVQDPSQIDFGDMMQQFGAGMAGGIPTGPSAGANQGWGGQQQGGYGGGGRRGRGRW